MAEHKLKIKAVRCKDLLCQRMTRKGYCPKHVEGLKADAFADLVRPALEKMGAAFLPSHLDDCEGECIGWQLALQTRVGLLTVSYHRGDFSLYGRFEDPKAATEALGNSFGRGEVNPYSGKWNHHYWDWTDASIAANACINAISRVLP